VDYRYEGLSRFLVHEIAKEFIDYPFVTLGMGVFDPGIKNFKENLKPIKKEERYYVICGGKIKSTKKKR